MSDVWRPMDTAPKDGREILLKVEQRAGIPGKCLVGHWMRGGHCIEDHPPIEAGWYFWTGRMFDAPSKPVGWRPLSEEDTAAELDKLRTDFRAALENMLQVHRSKLVFGQGPCQCEVCKAGRAMLAAADAEKKP